MATTYVYGSTNADEGVTVSLQQIGPDLGSAILSNSVLGKSKKRIEIARLARAVDEGVYISHFSFFVESQYIASLQVLLVGGGLTSAIWWRWQVAREESCRWVTDHNDHQVLSTANGKTYALHIAGEATIGYDDIAIRLERA
ncbi:hypothetical protein ACH495_12265 [Micromonospora sp. NPDC018662]|uniref:hypothetical protein n=1 Tax=Micromonospora sp. NPDC018662 TaxID=3364238 RepID=UPI00378A5A77